MHLIQVIVNVASWYIFKEKINSEFILENIVHRVDKRVVSLKQNFFLNLDILDLVFLQNNVFIKSFHSIDLVGYLILH